MKLYHGSPKDLKTLKPQLAVGETDFENQKAIFFTDSFVQAALYAFGKSLKGKTAFALPPEKLIIVGNFEPAKIGYVYEVNINAEKGDNYQFAYNKTITQFHKIRVYYEEFKDKITWVKTKQELVEICKKEKLKNCSSLDTRVL